MPEPPVRSAATSTPRPPCTEGPDLLGQALDALDGDARQALLLHYFAAMTFAEVAAQLQVPGPVVSARASRGLRQLGTALTGRGALPV